MNMHVNGRNQLFQKRVPRILLVAALVITGGFMTTLAVQASSSPKQEASPTIKEQPSVDQEKIMQQNTADEAQSEPKTTESINDDGSGATTTVTVNGETITVPANGSYERSTVDGNSRTDVKVDNQNQSSTSGNSSSNSSSSRIEVNSHSSSSSNSSQ